MDIAYFQGTSLIDYPGKVAAVVWTVGCNLRCPFCYNAELVLPELSQNLPRLSPEAVLIQLRRRTRLIEGVVVTGGEPTLQSDLADWLWEAKTSGLAVKLDTNGTHPEVLAKLLDRALVDYVALDVKGPAERYREFTGGFDVWDRVQKSLDLLRGAGIVYEARTTVAPGLCEGDLRQIAQELRGAQRYVLQPFFPAPKRLVDEQVRQRPALGVEVLRHLALELSRGVPCEVRG